MAKTKIAKANPFSGAPKINLPSVFGASPEKPIILRVAATGERPIVFSVKGLPNGLVLTDNIITGAVSEPGEYEVTLVAKNAHGEISKKITFEIKEENLLVTPLLGFTSWNSFGSFVSQESVLLAAHRMVDLGITEYGYSYVNLDSGWQHKYGGEFDAIMPNFKFPDMKAMTDEIHSLGLKCGIYSTPMLKAWGCPIMYPSIPGCTVGEPDKRFTDMNGGIGVTLEYALDHGYSHCESCNPPYAVD
jgi:alpha-galactosidase